jgi:hypothetical protein
VKQLLRDGAAGPAVRDLGERAQVKVGVENFSTRAQDKLLPQVVPAHKEIVYQRSNLEWITSSPKLFSASF